SVSPASRGARIARWRSCATLPTRRGPRTEADSLRKSLLFRPVILDGFDQRGQSRLCCLGGRLKPQVAQRLRCNRSNRDQGNGSREGHLGSFEQRSEVARGGGAGEGDGIRQGVRLDEELLKVSDGSRRNLGAVGVRDGDMRASGGESFGQNVTGLGGADEQEALACGFGGEGFGERFGDVARGDEIDREANSLHRASGGR